MSFGSAEAIKIGNRWFFRFGKGKRLQTAWSLAGAKLFLPDGRIREVTDALSDKGISFSICSIQYMSVIEE